MEFVFLCVVHFYTHSQEITLVLVIKIFIFNSKSKSNQNRIKFQKKKKKIVIATVIPNIVVRMVFVQIAKMEPLGIIVRNVQPAIIAFQPILVQVVIFILSSLSDFLFSFLFLFFSKHVKQTNSVQLQWFFINLQCFNQFLHWLFWKYPRKLL